MTALPIPGEDYGIWGGLLNDFLEVSLNSDGSLNTAAVLAAIGRSVTAGTYGNASNIPVLTVNAEGLITAITIVPVSGGGGGVTSVFGRSGVVTAQSGDYSVAEVTGAAPAASPTLTGTVTVPTPSPGDNTTKAASTAFVTTAVSDLAVTGDLGITSDVSTLEVTPNTLAVPFQPQVRRGGSVYAANAAEGQIRYGSITAVSFATLAVTVTSTLGVAIGQFVDVISAPGTTNVVGSWTVTALTSNGFTFNVSSTPSGTLSSNGQITATFPVLDVIMGHSIPMGEGSTIGLTDHFSVLGQMENRQAGLPDPNRGFRRCNAEFFTDGWSNLANSTVLTATGASSPGGGPYVLNFASTAGVLVGDQVAGAGIPTGLLIIPPVVSVVTGTQVTIVGGVTTGGLTNSAYTFTHVVTNSGPIAPYLSSWALSVAGTTISDLRTWRRAVVLFKRRTNGDGVQVSFNGGSTFTSTIDTNGSGYFMVDSGDLGTAVPRTVECVWQTHASGSGGAGVEIAGYMAYQSSGNSGAYNYNLAYAGTTTAEWITTTDWDTYVLPLVQPRRVVWMIGINDLDGGVSLSTLEANWNTLITHQSGRTLAEIVMACEWHPGNSTYNTTITGANWGTYVSAMQAVALAHGCTFIDMFARFGDVSLRDGDSGDPYGLTDALFGGSVGVAGDGIHPGDGSASPSGVDAQRAWAETYWQNLSYNHASLAAPAPGWEAESGTVTWFSNGNGSTVGDIFLVAGNKTGKYQPGTKVRWSLSGVVGYGVVTSAAFGNVNNNVTEVQLAPTTAFAMTATPDAGSVLFSFDEPPDFPPVFAMTGVFTGISGETIITTWSVQGLWCELTIITTVAGTSTATTTTMTNLPFVPTSIAYGAGTGLDDTLTPVTVAASFTASSSTVHFGNSVNGGPWTNVGNREIWGTFRYPIGAG